MLSDSSFNMTAMYGSPMTLRPNEWLEDGQELEIAGIKIKVIFTPGHTPGSASFYIEEGGFLISGDTLFQESVGRTDFKGGSAKTLAASIEEKLYAQLQDPRYNPQGCQYQGRILSTNEPHYRLHLDYYNTHGTWTLPDELEHSAD
jgi:hypothetical protein